MNLRDIAQRLRDNFNRSTQDNEGWVRQGQFTPGRQISNIAQTGASNFSQNIRQLPTIGNNFVRDQFNKVEQAPLIAPTPLGTAGNLASKFAVGQFKSIAYDPNTKKLFPSSPLRPENAPVSGDEFNKRYSPNGKFDVNRYIADKGEREKMTNFVLNTAGGDIKAAGVQAVLSKNRANIIKQAEPEIRGAIRDAKIYDKFSPETQMKIIQDFNATTKKIIPDILKTQEMKALSLKNPREFLNVASKALEDRLINAAHPEWNIGLNTKNIGKTPNNKIKIVSSPDIQSGRTQQPGNPQTMNQGKSVIQTLPRQSLPQPQKVSLKSSQVAPGIDGTQPLSLPNNTTKQRGLVTSVKGAENIINPVKEAVGGSYIPKTNKKLMGEAEALLQDGAVIDFKNTKDLDKKVAATIQEAINQQKGGNNEAAANLFNNLSEHATELGRGVQAFSLLKSMSPEAVALSAAGKIKKYNATHTAKIPELTGQQVKMIAEKVEAIDLLKGREKNIAMHELGQTIDSFIPSSLADKAITVWKAGLLTSLRTHERNFVGNTVHAVAETLKDIPATLADKFMGARTGQRTTTFTIKGSEKFRSKTTLQQMNDMFSKGYDPSEQVNKFDYKTITWGKNPVEQILKKYTDAVFRSLGVSDKPFYNAALARSLYDQAGAAAINASKKGDKSFIEALVKSPTEEMLKIAINDANIATFKNKNAVSGVANAVKRSMSQNELGKIAAEVTLPFTGVPSSIFGQIASYSPIGLLKGIYNTGKVTTQNLPELQRQASKELGRGVIGTGIFALGSYLMSKGIITGQPKDQAESRQWELENKPRNSILIGGKWRSLNSVGPEAVVFLAGAKFQEEMSNPEGSMANFGVGLGKDYLDQSFVQGLQAPVNAITDPQRYAKSYVGNLSSSVIPNIVKDTAKAFDPTAREANELSLNPAKNDYLKQSIPFVRNTMVPRRDTLGNEIKQEPSGIMAFIDLFNSKTPIDNSVVKELSRLNEVGNNSTPSKLTPSQTILKQKVKLTFEQLDSLEEGVGEALRPKLQQLISDPNYQRLDDESKAKAIDKVVQDTRTQYKNINAGSLGVTPQGTTVTPIAEPKLTGNKTIDDKLKLQYKNATEKQMMEEYKTDTVSDESKVYSYVDEDGNYKTVDLTPVEFPKLTGNTVVDKKLKSAYYSDINSQINGVIKLGQAGQITEDEMIKMVADLNEQYTKGKGSGKSKGGKITIKFTKYSAPKATFKVASARPSKLTLKKAPKVKFATTSKRKFTIKA